MKDISPEWPPELDALIAAPNHHKLLFENDYVRVLEVTIAPGETTPLHTHSLYATVCCISWSHFIRYDPDWNVLLESNTLDGPPQNAWWTGPIPPHYLKNTGEKMIHNICVEMKVKH